VSAAAPTVRRLGADDLAAFKAIRLEALTLEPQAFASTVADWENLDDAARLRNLTANPIFAAFRAGEPVGLLGLIREIGIQRAHRALIVMVYVRAAERGTGVAQAMLDNAVAFAREWGILQLELGVNAASARAIRFYERNGFVRFGLLPNFTLRDGVSTDEAMMARRIG